MTLKFSGDRQFSGTYKYVIGIDEAGRGPLAGPVVCAAFICLHDKLNAKISDSKVMSEEDRDAAYEEMISSPHIIWCTSEVTHTQIDEINILQASLLGMKQAAIDILNRLRNLVPTYKLEECIALVDGNKIPDNMPINTKCIIKGDSLVYSIAAASIFAKVTRDNLMKNLAKKYPLYLFEKHKGYPTFEHRQLLHQYGPCDIHRRSYNPVKLAIQRQNELNVEDKDIAKETVRKSVKEASSNSYSTLRKKIPKVVKTPSLKKSTSKIDTKKNKLFNDTKSCESDSCRRSERLRNRLK